jgi:hypothetical protein
MSLIDWLANQQYSYRMSVYIFHVKARLSLRFLATPRWNMKHLGRRVKWKAPVFTWIVMISSVKQNHRFELEMPFEFNNDFPSLFRNSWVLQDDMCYR